MQIQNNSWIDKSYPIFLYTGILFFVIHLLIYGVGLDQSYFGLGLAYIGFSRIGLYWWIFILLWIGVLLEGINLGRTIYEKYLKPTNSKKKRESSKKSEKSEK